MRDESKSNPSLHLLHTKWACKHLALVDTMIFILHKQGNTTLLDLISAMEKERSNLITNYKSYADATEILDMINEVHRELEKEDD